jgi:protein-tyrosine phosphatase
MSQDAPSLIKDELIDSEKRKLYLGSGENASDLVLLKQLGVTHILNVTTEKQIPNHFPDEFVYKRIAINDKKETPIDSHFEDAHDFVTKGHQENGVVFVHCTFGVSRSATVVISFIMKTYSLGLSDALDIVKTSRPIIKPNLGFMKQLVQYERNLLGKRSFDWNQYLDDMDFMGDARKMFQITSPEPVVDEK